MSKWAKRGEERRLRGSAGVARANRVKARAGYQCANCGVITNELEADHIVPLSQGGADCESNLQALCCECHSRKTARESAHGLRLALGKGKMQIGLDGWPVENDK